MNPRPLYMSQVSAVPQARAEHTSEWSSADGLRAERSGAYHPPPSGS